MVLYRKRKSLKIITMHILFTDRPAGLLVQKLPRFSYPNKIAVCRDSVEFCNRISVALDSCHVLGAALHRGEGEHPSVLGEGESVNLCHRKLVTNLLLW